MTKFSIYEHSEYRFVLGNFKYPQEKTLIYLGLKPSTATNIKDDNTTKRVTNWALTHNYKNIVFINIYPFVCLRPNDLPPSINNDEFEIHYKKVEDILNEIRPFRNYEILCAWGNDIAIREYLSYCKKRILSLFNTYEKKNLFKCLKITDKNNPSQIRHISNDDELIKFDIENF